MEPGGALASALFAAFSVPCLVVLLVLGEAGLRVAALRGSYGWSTRSALLGYRTARPAGSGFSHYDDEPPLSAECCDRLPRTLFRRRQGGGAAAGEPECAFCLSAVRDGDEVRELRCRHVFHRACLDAWLVRRPRATCPLCRDRLLPDNYFVDDLLSTSSPASAYAHGGALWLHMS